LREEISKEKSEVSEKLMDAMKIAGKAEELVAAKSSLENKVAGLETDNNNLRREVSNLTVQKAEFAKAQEHLKAEQAKLMDEKNNLLNTYTSEFKTIATKILNEQTDLFKTTNKTELEHIIKPLNEKLSEFQKRVEEHREIQTKDKADLANHIASVIKANTNIEDITRDFVNALRGESGVRGAWGEDTLRTLLNESGFLKDDTYYEQTVDDEGKRPDFIVRLPEKKLVIIDAKTVFNNYEKYVNETDLVKKKEHLTAHVKDIKAQISKLGTIRYQKRFKDFCNKLKIAEDNDPISYVLMWVNPEAAIVCAVKEDNDIIRHSNDNKVALVSGSSLTSTLKIIETLWINYTAQEKGEEIKELAEDLVSGFGRFLARFVEVRKHLNEATAAHDKATEIVQDEKGGLLPNAKELANVYPSKVSAADKKVITKMKYSFDGSKQNKEVALEDKGGGEPDTESNKDE